MVPVCPNGLTIELIDGVGAECGEPEARLTVRASGGVPPYRYKLERSQTWQASGSFGGIPPGSRVVAVEDADGCSTSIDVRLLTGISFAEKVEPLITAACAVSGCHGDGSQAPDFTIRDNILSAAGRMRQLVATRQMPPGSCNCPLTDEEKASILCWIDDGAMDN